MMKYAYVHDWIFHIGGAEKVFFDLIREQLSSPDTSSEPTPQITIYTLFSDQTTLTIDGHRFPVVTALPRRINNIFVRSSSPYTAPDLAADPGIDPTPYSDKAKRLRQTIHTINRVHHLLMQGAMLLMSLFHRVCRIVFDYRNLIVIYPQLTRRLWSKIAHTAPDQVIISSFAAVKNIIPVGKVQDTMITLYLHSPMQYIWENYEEYLHKLAAWQLVIFKPLARRLRKRDQQPRHYDTVYTNSIFTKRIAHELYFSKFSKSPLSPGSIIVKYPQLPTQMMTTAVSKTPRDYYLYVGRLVRFIRETDLIIRLANEIHIPLLVMGTGPDEDRLKSTAGDTVTFIGHVDDIPQKIDIIRHARGLINLAKESCGMATMEALALGVPVLGYDAGATPEFVNPTNGVLAQSKDMDHLIETFRVFHQHDRHRSQIQSGFLEKYKK